jgi:hypothetical protein
MIDVFLCTAADEPIRQQMFTLTSARWAQEAGIHLHIINPTRLECDPHEFQRLRRIYADEHADTSIYVVADDDCLLPGRSPLPDVVPLMEQYSEFAVLSLLPANANIYPWTPSDRQVICNDDVMEHVSVGGIRFCRKGLLKIWPDMEGHRPVYDKVQCEQIRREGRRVGYARQFKMNHLGEGYSGIWKR